MNQYLISVIRIQADGQVIDSKNYQQIKWF